MKTKLLDLLNLLLVVSIVSILVLKVWPVRFLSKTLPQVSPSTSSAISNWGRDRDFPPDFSEDEKLILTEQKHDYERTTEEDEAVYQRFLGLTKSMPVSNRNISVFKYGNDCFARPVAVKILAGQKIYLKNIGKENINIGIGKGNWDIFPGEQIEVVPAFDNMKLGENLQGYSCSTLGLAGYLVIVKN